MKFYVGVTDNNWFSFLQQLRPDELNFWQPGGTTSFRAIEPGALFLFKLHSPDNFIVGGGYFVRHTFLPVSIAWDVFGQKNGCEDYHVFASRIRAYRRRKGDADPDPNIGCIVLTMPFFFSRDQWIPAPPDWKGSIVQGKGYSTTEPIGSALWDAVAERLSIGSTLDQPTPTIVADLPRFGTAYLARPRLGQGGFRVLVTEAYSRRCAFTGEKTLPVLQAAHIKPYAESGPHNVQNGLLLRSDLHLLFDKGLLTVTPDYHIEVSSRINSQYHNGKIYYALHGQPLAVLPERVSERPDPEYLLWHNSKFY
jgi:putative restriction endonuclease